MKSKLLLTASVLSLVATGALAAPIGTYSKGAKQAVSQPAAVDTYHYATPPVATKVRGPASGNGNPKVTDPDPQVRHNMRINQSNQ